MNDILVDAGPLIALFDQDDAFHLRTVEQLRGNTRRLVSTWPVVTEVVHMLDFSTNAQMAFLEWLGRGGVSLVGLDQADVPDLMQLMRRYAERLKVYEILSIDRDFDIYRTAGGSYIRAIRRSDSLS